MLILALAYYTTWWHHSHNRITLQCQSAYRAVYCCKCCFAELLYRYKLFANRLLLCMLQVKADKLREVKNGHDGTWVAHPALVTLALEIFNEHMPQPNQIDKKREDVHVTRENLLEVSYCLSV